MDPEHRDWIRRHNKKVQQDREMDKKLGWKSEMWYHGSLDRATTDTILAGRRPGMFLVRDSTTCPGDFVLSVSENSKVSHYIISRRGGLYLIGDQSFTDFPAVIDFYRKHFLDTTTLIEAAPNPRSLANSQPSQSMGPQSMGPVTADPSPAVGVAPVAQDTMPPPIPVVGTLIVKGKFDFNSADDEDLTFKKGDIMEVIRKDEDDWWFAKHSDGRTGSIPVPYVQIVEDNSVPFRAKAIKDRECPYDPTALTFKTGDIIKVTKQNENGMWEGELNGKVGHFPFKLVELIDDSH